MRRPFALVGLAGVVLGLASMRCAEATAVVVEVYSEVPCSANAQVVLFGGRSLSDLATAAPAATATTCTAASDGTVRRGNVVITPATSNDETIAFALATRPDGTSAETGCFGASSGSCIVAKRQFRFLSRTTLNMRVDLRTSCLGVTCDPTSTCVKGKCVDASVNTTACGGKPCDENTLTPPGDGGVEAGPDAAADGGADAPPDAPEPACNPTHAFANVAQLAQLGSTGTDIGVGLTGDELLGVMWSNRTGIGRIYTTDRALVTDPFTAPTIVPGLEVGGFIDRDPTVTADGLGLVFSSNRPGGAGGFDLWTASRGSRNVAFANPQPLAAVSTAGLERTPFLRHGGLALYLSAGDPGGLFVSRRTIPTDPFPAPSPIAELNTASVETHPVVTPDDRIIYFATDRGVGIGLSVWRATRATEAGPFGVPERVVELDGEGDEVPLWVSHDDCTIYFSRGPLAGNTEIFRATRTK